MGCLSAICRCFDGMYNCCVTLSRPITRLCMCLMQISRGFRTCMQPCFNALGKLVARLFRFKVCIGLGLLLLFIMQVCCSLYAINSSIVMQEDFMSVTKSKHAEIQKVMTENVWGPVVVIVPQDCSEVQERDKRLIQLHTQCPIHTPMQRLNGTQVSTTLPATQSSTTAKYWEAASSSSLRSTAQASPTQAQAEDWAASSAHSVESTTQAERRLAGIQDAMDWVDSKLNPLFGCVKLAKGAKEEDRRRKVLITNSDCKYSLTFHEPRFWDRYFSMMLVGMSWRGTCDTGQDDHMSVIQEQRKGKHIRVIAYLLVIMFLKYVSRAKTMLVNVYQVKAGCLQSDRTTRTRFDRQLETVVLYMGTSTFILVMQIAVPTMYMAFWREGHFIMTYIPLMAIRIYFWSLIIILVLNEVEKVNGWFVRGCRTTTVFLFWFGFSLWFFFLTAPMVGTAANYLQFQVQVEQCYWLEEDKNIFSEIFVKAGGRSLWVCGLFVILYLVEAVLVLAIDQFTGVSQQTPSVPPFTLPVTYDKLYDKLDNS